MLYLQKGINPEILWLNTYYISKRTMFTFFEYVGMCNQNDFVCAFYLT
jgi:hypothetical protein